MRLGDLARTPAEVKQEVLAWVDKTRRRSGWVLKRILAGLGVPKSVYYDWLKRRSADRLADEKPKPPRLNQVLAEEREAIIAFAQKYPKIGYRKLAWMMLDQGIVAVDESTVYRVLNDVDLLSRWKRSESSPGEYRFRPTQPNEQWHTDVLYIWVAGCWYFLLSFIDAFSRYIVHHRLLLEINGRTVSTELEAALEKAGGAKPRVVHDHGPEFVNRDLAAVIKAHNLLDIRTRRGHPESNGVVERFNGTVRQEANGEFGGNYLAAEAKINELIKHYNAERLHAALGYMEPSVWHFGNPEARRHERAERLARARSLRRAINRERLEGNGQVA